MDAKPLSGIRVLAIEQLMALPFGTQLLFDYGTMLDGAEGCRRAGLAAAPINGPADVLVDPHFAARRMIATVERPDRTPLRVAGNPIEMSAVAVDDGCRPRIAGSGEHTREVLRDELGMDDGEYDELLAAGIIAEG